MLLAAKSSWKLFSNHNNMKIQISMFAYWILSAVLSSDVIVSYGNYPYTIQNLINYLQVIPKTTF